MRGSDWGKVPTPATTPGGGSLSGLVQVMVRSPPPPAGRAKSPCPGHVGALVALKDSPHLQRLQLILGSNLLQGDGGAAPDPPPLPGKGDVGLGPVLCIVFDGNRAKNPKIHTDRK